MKALDFRTPLVAVEKEIAVDPNYPEITTTVTVMERPEKELTEDDLAELAANEAGSISIEEMTAARDRNIRNNLLLECDWINNADITMTDEKKAEWVAYRQALRDITNHENFPDLMPEDWPTQPT